ncbi:hypothetical protein SAMN00120144_0386 [Hymenobacter roseosalivarius DSM 11622]|uniref:Uncharacterized protein n=1 Tax=Hymenobacter roseosalivarius DSM 11622 TaxID=645990 RepID=A0A1W1VVE8_9BACT|nr:hypothetical protein [Hymenobacter roseosalivarius]SMB97355.1 hypothetical protein SAMN00120144_0386 [Hymenobacter roseosalivarius DSM 11622]
MVENNKKWHQIRLRLAEFSLHFHPQKTIEFLDACRASRSLRQLLPYISLGRLGLECYDANERGQSDEFVCLYFHQDQYTVSSYDNTEKRYFDNPQAAIDFVEQSLAKENPFAKSASVEV